LYLYRAWYAQFPNQWDCDIKSTPVCTGQLHDTISLFGMCLQKATSATYVHASQYIHALTPISDFRFQLTRVAEVCCIIWFHLTSLHITFAVSKYQQFCVIVCPCAAPVILSSIMWWYFRLSEDTGIRWTEEDGGFSCFVSFPVGLSDHQHTWVITYLSHLVVIIST